MRIISRISGAIALSLGQGRQWWGGSGGRLRDLAARPAVWVATAVAIAVLEHWAGPYIQLGILYLVPIVPAAWYGGRAWGLGLALSLAPVRLLFLTLGAWEPPGTLQHAVVNAAVRATTFGLVAMLVHHTRRTRELARQVATLEGLLPICMYCKRIEKPDGGWEAVEQYVSARSEADFTHRVCPLCESTRHLDFTGITLPDGSARKQS